jgi:hypothetical protein
MSEETTPTPTYCYYHPDVETSLRCNKCNKPICPKDAILVDTGYRCIDCVREQQKRFDTAKSSDYIVIFLVTGILSFLGGLLIYILPWGFLSIFISPAIGGGIAAVANRSVGHRRSNQLFQLATIAVILGSLPFLIMHFYPTLNLWGIIWQGWYTVSVTSTMAYRLKGIRL